MVKNMRISDHIYNYSDIGRNHDGKLSKAETQTTNRGTSEIRFLYAARVTCQKIQKMWQIKLPLCRGTRARELCPFCQYAWQKPPYGLRLTQKQRHGDASFSQLPKYSKNHRRNQQYQSKNASPKGTFVTEKPWHSRQKYPP